MLLMLLMVVGSECRCRQEFPWWENRSLSCNYSSFVCLFVVSSFVVLLFCCLVDDLILSAVLCFVVFVLCAQSLLLRMRDRRHQVWKLGRKSFGPPYLRFSVQIFLLEPKNLQRLTCRIPFDNFRLNDEMTVLIYNPFCLSCPWPNHMNNLESENRPSDARILFQAGIGC